MLTKNTLRASFVFSIPGRLAVVVVIFLMCGIVATAQGRKYGLFVGINEYPRADERLLGAVNDATKLRQQMIKDFGFAESDTKALTDAVATRKAIIDNIKAYQQQAQAGDLFLFTYSGHGTLFLDAKSAVMDETEKKSVNILIPGLRLKIPLDFYDSAIVPVDADNDKEGRAWKNLILDDELYDLFSAFTQKQVQVIFLSDSCHSGTLAKGANNDTRMKFISPFQVLGIKSFDDLKPRKPATPKKASPDKGSYILLAASKDDELSWDVDRDTPDPGGLFTKVLLKALTSGQGPLTYTELLARVQPVVIELSLKGPAQQTPQIDMRFGDANATIFSIQQVK
jgi:hypothetical protein